MALQSAPDTLTLAVTGGNAVFSLFEVSDTMITYKGTTLAGAAYSANEIPVLTISRRPERANAASTRYTVRLVHPGVDALGTRMGTFTDQDEVVYSSGYLTALNPKQSAMQQSMALLKDTTFFKTMIADGSWAR